MKTKKPKVSLKAYADLHAHYLEKMIDDHKNDESKQFDALGDRLTEAIKMLFERFESLSARINISDGTHEGADKGWGYIIAALTIIISLAAVYFSIHRS